MLYNTFGWKRSTNTNTLFVITSYTPSTYITVFESFKVISIMFLIVKNKDQRWYTLKSHMYMIRKIDKWMDGWMDG